MTVFFGPTCNDAINESYGCLNCGGHPDCAGGRFKGPDGFTYCSEDCWEEADEFAARQRERASGWCPTCGYDRHEHAPDCAARIGGPSDV